MSNSTQPPQAALDQIIGFYNQGQLEQTASLAESLAKQYPMALILYDILGAAYMGLKNADKTIESYQKALQLNPNHTDAYNNMGMALYDQGKFDEAVESYQKAIKLEPDFADAHYNLGNALKQTGELKQAIESYRASLAINPSDAEVLLSYGNTLKNYGDFDQAIEAYAQTLKINPNSAAAQTNMDDAVDEKTEIDKNVADYARVGKLEIGSAEIASFTGILLKARGYLDAAIDCYKQAIKIEPDYAEAYNDMGSALQNKGELDAAVDSYKQAIKIRPDYAEAHSNMGNALQTKGKLEAAIDSYKQAIKIKPDYADAYSNMGSALKDKGELDAAVDSYSQAIKIKPDYAEAYYNMGVALQFKGELDAAIDSYKQAAKLFSNDAVAAEKVQPWILKALYEKDDKSRVCKKLDELIGLGYNNAIIGSIASRAALKFDVTFDNPFCNDPINYVFEKSLLKLCNFEDDFVKPSKKVLGFEKVSKRNQSLLIKGIQTAGNLFSTENHFAEEVQKIIRIELEKYRNKFKDSSEGLILSWPRGYTLYGWLVSMKSGGAIRPHMHENGWISGSIYINVPQSRKKDSGNLVVCVDDTNESPEYKQIIDVSTGSLCLFPSSLLHYTIPFESTEERIVLAFDMIPQ